jgi:quercetin dioxygenase-like cupin family protein
MGQDPNEVISVGAMRVRFLVEAADSNGTATVFEVDVPANAQMPAPHSHDAFEETVYGLSGVTTYTVDGRSVPIGPGDALCIPRGAVHGFENRGDADARLLAIATPGVFGKAYFLDVGEVLAAPGPPDRARIGEVMRRHGLTPAAPAGS